jgi:hypothetical protein
VHVQVAICVHMESIFILQPWVFWIVGMSKKAKCDTFWKDLGFSTNTQKPVNFLRKGFNFLKCCFSFLLMLYLHKNNISESWRELLLLLQFSDKKRNIVIMDPRSACALLGTYKVRNEINEMKRNRLIWRKWKEKNKRQNEIKK